jgi:hypothetical protein
MGKEEAQSKVGECSERDGTGDRLTEVHLDTHRSPGVLKPFGRRPVPSICEPIAAEYPNHGWRR